MKTSEQINEIATALAKAQGTIENASKNATNPHFKNSYADLGEVLATVRPVLSANNIAVVQMTAIEDSSMVLHTRLIHTSGQWIESVHPVASLPEKPQTIGANETYARRYSLAAICGISQEDDDLADGRKAAPVGARKQEGPTIEQISVSSKVKVMLLSGVAEAQTEADLTEWRNLSSTKEANRKLIDAHREEIKTAVLNRETALTATRLEAAE